MLVLPRLKCVSHALELDHLFDHRFPVLAISGSVVDGFGVFAGEPIKEGAVVLPLYGVLFRISKGKSGCPKYGFQFGDDFELNPCNEATFLNHSCEPNTYVNDDWLLVAMKGISKGEELTMDYGTVDWFDYGFRCNCNSPGCRKTYHGKICEDAQFRKRSGRFFSPFLKEKFGLK